MKPKLSFLAAIAICIGLLSGCASIADRSSYPIQIDSNPPGATVVVKDLHGNTVFEGKTPAQPIVDAGAGYFRKARYSIECSYGDSLFQTRVLNFEISPWYFGNLLFGGPLGLFLVDPLTGAMWQPVYGSIIFRLGEMRTRPADQ